jgi:formylglycine-generating enzyme required for sulfatase activity
VVHIARSDALAYARWLGRDLPTEAEWEYAAGGDQDDDSDGEPRGSGGPLANYWQGAFPDGNTAEDGFSGTAPVKSFPANHRGLHDMIGNVWEWTRDRHALWVDRASADDQGSHRQGTGLHGAGAAVDDTSPGVIKGGSYLCAPSHCVRFRTAARHPQDPEVSASHVGFRTILRRRAGG